MKRYLGAMPTPGRPPRPPLRTIAEIAGDLGISVQMLARLLNLPGAPRCRINNHGKRAAHPAMWYEPREVYAWVARWREGDVTGRVTQAQSS